MIGRDRSVGVVEVVVVEEGGVDQVVVVAWEAFAGVAEPKVVVVVVAVKD